MIVLSASNEGADIRLSGDELWMINNALNWVCNGGDFVPTGTEFQTIHGFERPEMSKLLDEIHAVVPPNA